MEFFQELNHSSLDLPQLSEALTISNLPSLCDSINSVISDHGNQGEIHCVWGQFNVTREELKTGVRFSLVNFPHAFAWTITLHDDPQKLVIHCTNDKQHLEQDFFDTIVVFMEDFVKGLGKLL